MSELPVFQSSVAGTVDRAGVNIIGNRFLHSVVVSCRGSPDQVTVYLRRDNCCDRMNAWLTTDTNAFVSLDEMC